MQLSDKGFDSLLKSSSRARCYSTLLFLSVAFSILGLLLKLSGAGIRMPGMGGRSSPTPILLEVIITVIQVGFYLFLAISSWKFATWSRESGTRKDRNSVLQAQQANLAFWKTLGIFFIILLALFVIAFVFAFMASPRF